jgi:transcriptional regulator with XRE-family HTH domain
MLNAAQLKEIRKLFGIRVRELRKEQGYSQEDFADECGLHRTYIGAIERGERNVSIDNIARIADALKIEMGELFGGC